MSASSFLCPHCSMTLRVRDRKYIGRRIACPDCRQPIEIVADGPRALSGRAIALDGTAARQTWRERLRALGRRKASSQTTADAVPVNARPAEPPRESPRSPGRMARAAALLASPIGVAWTVASVVTLGLVVLIWPSDGASSRAPGADAAGGSRATDAPTDGAGSQHIAPGGAANDHAPPAADDPIRQRLIVLGERLETWRADRGHFSSGTVLADGLEPTDRFSWLAELASEADPPGQPQPLWDQPWHDPLNDRFVRRPRAEFLNPAVDEQTGANRFPATHFVGVAGVGTDAAELRIDHPRAGIFGYDRQTRLEDIRDGAANTLLVAGVQERLGGWAGGGPGSVRGFARVPYVNGPDGFGTGQAGSMLVLMADGSVRAVSKATSPVIVRRMAAMADGFPLDEAVPGEPGDAPPVSPEPVEQPAAVANAPGAAPAEDAGHAAAAEGVVPADVQPPDVAPGAPGEAPVPAPEPAVPKVDIVAALAQKIEHYELPRPVVVRRLLLELEEMIGVPLEAAGGNTVELEARLDRTVSVRLEQTTVGDILDEITQRAGLAYIIEDGAIRLRPAD